MYPIWTLAYTCRRCTIYFLLKKPNINTCKHSYKAQPTSLPQTLELIFLGGFFYEDIVSGWGNLHPEV